ncbi:SDR family NAD(P)-dependent oxidoreductase [Candidatus Bathyarchaeota archaeon]|nr:SDR family NAD(P)-dependent oxidoreductase [Candidatus Bathyarchaeota archaeon]
MGKTALVTGGAGFIGSHLVDRLVAEGYFVKVIDDLSTGQLSNIASHVESGRVEFLKGDIRDQALIKKAVEGVDAVAHLAALTSVPFSMKNPDLVYDVNVSGSLNLIFAAIEAGVGRFVFASSCAVYGDTKVLPVSELAAFSPLSPYAESKLAIERCLRGLGLRGALDSVVLRFFNVYGLRQGLSEYSGVITKFFDCAKSRQSLVVYGDGSQTRDFVNVADIVEGIYSALTVSGVEGGVFNLGTGKPTSVNDLAHAVLDLTGAGVGIHYEPARLGEIKESYADISKAKQLLKFGPKVTLREGLAALV